MKHFKAQESRFEKTTGPKLWKLTGVDFHPSSKGTENHGNFLCMKKTCEALNAYNRKAREAGGYLQTSEILKWRYLDTPFNRPSQRYPR